jgi:hypothetical protein
VSLCCQDPWLVPVPFYREAEEWGWCKKDS